LEINQLLLSEIKDGVTRYILFNIGDKKQ